MSHTISLNNNELQVAYNWKKKNQDLNLMWVKANPVLKDIVSGSEEEFIFEHYYGYNKLNETTTVEYSLAHPRWQVYPVTDYQLHCNVEKLYGASFVPFIQNVQPVSIFLAKGSDVQVKMPKKLSK